MFRVVLMCDDRRLAEVLRTLAGKVLGAPEVTPVVNATANGKGHVTAMSSGQIVDMLAVFLSKRKLTEGITSNNVREFCREAGRSDKSYSYVLKQAVEKKLLRKTGKGTLSRYKVIT